MPEANGAEEVDFSDVQAVTEVPRRRAVDGVVAISTDRAVPVAVAVAKTLGLPELGIDVAAQDDRQEAHAAAPRPGWPTSTGAHV